MIDFLKLAPPPLYLTDEAVSRSSTTDRFVRNYSLQGKAADGRKITMSFPVNGYSPVKIRGHQLKCGRFWVGSIMAVLPSLLHGHNGRPLRTAEELGLALTILAHIVALATKPSFTGRIIPGVSTGNLGHILSVEASVQLQDPDQRLLLGSHLARMRNQQRPTGIYLGQTSSFRSRGRKILFYDKNAKVYYGVAEPADIGCTRVESFFSNDERLSKDVKTTGIYSGKPGEVVATLSLDTSYALLRQSLARLINFGWHPCEGNLEGLGKNARLLVCGLRDRIRHPHELDAALEAFKRTHHPKGGPTYRKVERELRAYALRTLVPHPLDYFPEDSADLKWSDVHWPDREQAWAILMRDIGAPTEPDPAIAAAWSQTTFLAKRPEPFELIGTVAPARLPFLTKTL